MNLDLKCTGGIEVGKINFDTIKKQCEEIAKTIEEKQEELEKTLMQYQSYDVAVYEIKKCMHTLKTIDENRQYFKEKVGAISVFMPSNLPLYSLVIFALIPGFIAERLYIYPNTILRKQKIIQSLHDILQIKEHLPNIEVFEIEGNAKDAHKVFIEEYVKKSQVIIFTGRGEVKKKIEEAISNDSILIHNGVGHNPVVVAEDANIDKAVEDSVSVKFFNSGQDCAGPDSILVHKKVVNDFIKKFKDKCSELKVGDYSDAKTYIGPIHRGGELNRLKKIIDNNRSSVVHIENVVPGKEVNRDKKIVYPTIISLKTIEKANFCEIFGPIAFIVEYETDEQLKLYFQNDCYKKNKMYVSLYGSSKYIESADDIKLLTETVSTENGVGIVLYNQTIHNVEVGTKAYGGYSEGASSVKYKNSEGKTFEIAIPILIPQVITELLTNKMSMEKLQELVNKKLIDDLRSELEEINTAPFASNKPLSNTIPQTHYA